MACRRPKRGLLRQAIHQASQSPGFADELLVQVWKNWKIMDDQKAAEGKAKDTQIRNTHTHTQRTWTTAMVAMIKICRLRFIPPQGVGRRVVGAGATNRPTGSTFFWFSPERERKAGRVDIVLGRNYQIVASLHRKLSLP